MLNPNRAWLLDHCDASTTRVERGPVHVMPTYSLVFQAVKRAGSAVGRSPGWTNIVLPGLTPTLTLPLEEGGDYWATVALPRQGGGNSNPPRQGGR